MKIAQSSPESIPEVQFRKGRPRPKELTQEQRDWAGDPARLREQVGLSLKARREAFNLEFGTKISHPQFRQLYREVGITKQKMTSRLGGKKLASQQKQAQDILELQKRVQAL